MKRLWNTIAGLRLGFEEHFRGAGSISLFVGLACNLAFVGQVYFWPSMWHTTAFMFSYTDASYVAELLCALMLGWRLRRGGRLVVGSRLLWVLALLVQATLVLYCALFGAGIHVPEPVNWVCGAIFGVYLPVAMTSWFAVHIDRRSFSVIWNIVLAGVFASFVIWVFSGLEAVKLCVCMGVLMFVGTFVLSRKLRSEQAKEEDDAAVPAAVPADAFRYPASATFLFSFSFITAIAFAGIGGDSASYASGISSLRCCSSAPWCSGKCGGPPADDHRCARYHRGRHSRLLSSPRACALIWRRLACSFSSPMPSCSCAPARRGLGGTLLRPSRALWWPSPPDASSAAWAWRSASRSSSNSRRTSWFCCLFWLPTPP
ncbi:MAG: hypothetical protein ACLSDQ_00645 [Adlercreutzia equolifaciens]